MSLLCVWPVPLHSYFLFLNSAFVYLFALLSTRFPKVRQSKPFTLSAIQQYELSWPTARRWSRSRIWRPEPSQSTNDHKFDDIFRSQQRCHYRRYRWGCRWPFANLSLWSLAATKAETTAEWSQGQEDSTHYIHRSQYRVPWCSISSSLQPKPTQSTPFTATSLPRTRLKVAWSSAQRRRGKLWTTGKWQ